MRAVKVCVFALLASIPLRANADIATIASAEYVVKIVTALGVPELAQRVDSHTENTSNPHNVTKTQIGLSNVQNIDTTNAANITSGTLDVARIPVGTTNTTVASGSDTRFDSIPSTAPGDTPPDGRVYIWFSAN